MAAVLDLTAGEVGARAVERLVGVGVLAAIPSALDGASDWSDIYGAERGVGLVHAVGNFAAVSLQATSYVARRRDRRRPGMALSAAGVGIMAAVGYLGGHLSFNRGVGGQPPAFEEAVAELSDVASLPELASDKPVRVSAAGGVGPLGRGGLRPVRHLRARRRAARRGEGGGPAACPVPGMPAPSGSPTARSCAVPQPVTSRAGRCASKLTGFRSAQHDAEASNAGAQRSGSSTELPGAARARAGRGRMARSPVGTIRLGVQRSGDGPQDKGGEGRHLATMVMASL